MTRILLVFAALLFIAHTRLTIALTGGHQVTIPLGWVLIFALAALLTAWLSRTRHALRRAW